MEAVKDFLDGEAGSVAGAAGGALSEIHLMDNRQEGGQAFVAALKAKFKVKHSAAPPIPPRINTNVAGYGHL